jgi:N-acetylglucosaminyl-diphospho-decaprenol L-rhamnosyltransferase
MKKILDVVIVNWNSGSHLRRCLETVESSVRDAFEFGRVVVVDNASTDSSLSGLSFPGIPFMMVQNSENRGFAAACNQGAGGSQADYLLFLNPDVRLETESLGKVIHFMEQPANARFAICSIQLFDSEQRISRTCARFPTPKSLIGQMLGLDRIFPRWVPGHFLPYPDHLQSKEVDQVIGAFFVVRRKVFESLSGFDARFFVYFEDMDLSYRAFRSGWYSYYLTSSWAHHKGGGCSEQVRALRLYYSLKSRILYGFKHFGSTSAIAVLLGTLLIEPLSRLALAIAHNSLEEIEATIQGYAMLWGSLKTLLKRVDGSIPDDGPNRVETVA